MTAPNKQDDSGSHAKAFMDAVKSEAARLTLEAVDEVLLKWASEEATPKELPGLDRARSIVRGVLDQLEISGWAGKNDFGGHRDG